MNVLLDTVSSGLRLLALQHDQVLLVLAIGRIKADAAAHDEHAANQRDDQRRVLREQAPAQGHSITSSARMSSSCGIVSLSATAVLRLIAKWNFVGCSIGKSPGLAPFMILL